ncbi:creatininase family protein [Caballeronia mineralivorans]|uniref:creatininase family protein n=1 Tax=Caballeronia mineralivorans TaxID=2010198 RepID=UPI0023F31D54|nr:creatininase family protein [Caballeronia mineralivorans]MDB5783464.1 creatininase [Caballeronia mineralivorans]MEA3097894.1 creatinine amidohydrolase [Caballeronia mineralivorans]
MQRHLSQMTWTEIRDLDKEAGVVVLPIGSLEQHGAHLTINTDTYFAERFLELTLEQLPDDVKVWCLPAMPITNSREHEGFAGSFWLSASTMMNVLRDIGASIARSGFRRLLLWNCHGGNISLLDLMAREIRADTGLLVFTCFPPAALRDPVETSQQEAAFGIHANDWETSVMMALAPDQVRADKLTAEYPHFAPGHLKLEGSAANVAWLTRDLSQSGVLGDATISTAERGWQRLNPLVPKWTDLLSEISTFEFAS